MHLPNRRVTKPRGARCLALSLIIPLLFLQTLQASTLYCSGLSHASLLAFTCPHHERADTHGEGGSSDHSGHASDDGLASTCTCPSDNALPAGLIITALGGLGLPVAGLPEPAWPSWMEDSATDALHPPVSWPPPVRERPPRARG